MEILPFVATEIKLEGIVLSEIRQTQKEKKLHGLTYMRNLKRSRELNRETGR